MDGKLEKIEEPSPAVEPLEAERHARRMTSRRFLASIVYLVFISLVIIRWEITNNSPFHPPSGSPTDDYYDAQVVHGIATAYTKKHALRGKRAEKLFLSVPEEKSAIAASRQYATQPHLAGSPGDLITAIDFLALLQHELGVDVPARTPIYSAGTHESRSATLSIPKLTSPQAWIDEYYPVMNTPLDRSLQILDEFGSPIWSAELEEVADDTDPEAGKYANAVPAWHGLSRGGEAEGKLVFANYGRKEDYDALVTSGVDLTGKIVITRYGGIFRGLKVKGAQELGALAVLIYSDPRDDGTVTEKNGYLFYPHGPARNPTSVQRGSVQFLSIYPGDPTTPGFPAYANSTRTEGSNIPQIPSLPISWKNAEVLLREIGEGGKTIRLVNHVDDKVTPIWNTMAVIPGHIKSEIVLIGNHRDAWVMGATDPSSGTVSVHEVIRGFGKLLKNGWTPLRTIVIASWDAEEYGLIGSTEWGEDFGDFISDHVVTYLNLDSSTSGSRFRASASPSLAHLVQQTAKEISHPTKANLTLWDARKDSGNLTGPSIEPEVLRMYEEAERAFQNVGEVGPLGSGSDYTVFLQHIGIASSNGGFGSTLSDPVYHYHSVYDSELWQEIYGDPGFYRHVAVAKHLGLQALRLADSIVLPLNTTHYAYELGTYLKKVESIALELGIAPDFAPLQESIGALQDASGTLDVEKHEAEHELRHLLKKEKKKAKSLGRRLKHGLWSAVRSFAGELATCSHHVRPGKKLIKAVKRVQKANEKLVAFERGLISKEGIKDREWYKHLGVAPGKWLGYGATTFPALTESLTIDGNVTEAQHEASRLKSLIDKLAKEIHA